MLSEADSMEIVAAPYAKVHPEDGRAAVTAARSNGKELSTSPGREAVVAETKAKKANGAARGAEIVAFGRTLPNA